MSYRYFTFEAHTEEVGGLLDYKNTDDKKINFLLIIPVLQQIAKYYSKNEP